MSLRRVATLRLRSRDESLNRRGAILIEDALRTASLPDADGGRLWVVRKLALGRIHAGDPPSAVALRIEARFRESGAIAVHAESPHAPAADAVYFDDDVEPYTALALRLARGESAAAWYWPLAARGWTPSLPRDEAMRVLLAGALASAAGPIAALALIRALVRHTALDPLAAALRFQDGAPLMRSFGWIDATCRKILPLTPQSQRPADAPSPLLELMAAPWFAAWGATDARTHWLACALYAVERPALASQSSLPAKALAWIESIVASPSAPHPTPVDPEPPVGQAVSLRRTSSPPLSNQSSPATEPLPDPISEAVESAQPHSPLFTLCAGLFFLVPAMHRLGMPKWLEQHPHLAEWSIPYLVLRAIARRLETPPGDPILAALGELPEDPPAEVHAAVTDWVRRLRRYSRRIARMGLYDVVCRPGHIVFTETHIDVFFRLDRADIRVRRAGLDIDPGWTPWLPRVIHFHYQSEGYHG